MTSSAQGSDLCDRDSPAGSEGVGRCSGEFLPASAGYDPRPGSGTNPPRHLPRLRRSVAHPQWSAQYERETRRSWPKPAMHCGAPVMFGGKRAHPHEAGCRQQLAALRPRAARASRDGKGRALVARPTALLTTTPSQATSRPTKSLRYARDEAPLIVVQRAEGGDALGANKAREGLPEFGVQGRSPCK
jgi:hypothetical protein